MFDYSNKKKVIVVYDEEDELSLNLIKKLVETDDDDKENSKIIGTEDDTVSIIPWTEKDYRDNKKAPGNKIIFLDDIKGIDKTLIPILDVKFNAKGVKYGFAGNQAVISIDESEIETDEDFKALSDAFEDLLISENEQMKPAFDPLGPKEIIKRKRIQTVLWALFCPIVGAPFIINAIITEAREKKRIRDLLFAYGITKFYLDDMDEFIKS